MNDSTTAPRLEKGARKTGFERLSAVCAAALSGAAGGGGVPASGPEVGVAAGAGVASAAAVSRVAAGAGLGGLGTTHSHSRSTPRDIAAARRSRFSIRPVDSWLSARAPCDRIQASPTERVAAGEAPDGHSASAEEAVAFDGLPRVDGACRLEATGPRQKRRQPALVDAQKCCRQARRTRHQP